MDGTKRVFLTGCSRGIGLSIAKVSIAKKWEVTGTARKSEFPKSLNDSDRFSGVYADLAFPEKLESLLKPELLKSSPDVLINNAGIFTDAGFEADDDHWLDVWNRTQHVNLTSAALLCKWFIQMHVQNNTEGIIINIASRASYRGDTQEYSAYAASKAGLVGLTKSIARGYSNKGVVAYSIAPGFIETDMAKDAVELLGKEHITRDSVFDEITQPDEVAELVVFLAKGRVRHATGQTFHINGGSYMI